MQRKYNEARAQYKLAEDAWEDPEKNGPFPDPASYAIAEDPKAPVDSSYEVTYEVAKVVFNPKFW